MSKLLHQNYCKISKLSQNIKIITKYQNVVEYQNYYKVKIIANVKIITKCAKYQNYHENKHKFIYIKLNILNSNTSEMIKLQFIKLYISYFYLNVTSLLMQTIYYLSLF